MEQKKAYGRLSLDWNLVMSLMTQGTHNIELRHSLPKLPEGVTVHSVHNDPAYMSFMFILVSDEPVDKWTYEVEVGLEVPISEASCEMLSWVVHNIKE